MKNLALYPLWTAIITPMKEDGAIDFSSLTQLLKEQEEAGNGIVVLGSTGEALNLNDQEKKAIVEHTVSLSLKTALMVGIGGINLTETKDWLSYLETKPFDCYLMVTPLYSKPGPKGQYLWFKELLDASTKPSMLYNIPGRTGKNLDHKAVKELVGHPRFWAIKEASGLTLEFSQYVLETNQKVAVYSGDDALLPSFYPYGCQGLVSVASNIWPKETHAWVKKVLNNKANLKEVHLWEKCTNALFIASNPIPVKVLMHDLKKIKSATLRAPLTFLEIDNLAPLREAHQKIQDWFKNQKDIS